MQPPRTVTRAVLGLLYREQEVPEVLLGVKKKKLLVGARMGFGGRIEQDETPTCATVREAAEEIGVTILPAHVVPAAVITFDNALGDNRIDVWQVYISIISRWEGEPRGTAELGDLRWYRRDALPAEIPVGDREWLPRMLRGECLQGVVYTSHDRSALRGASRLIPIHRFHIDRLWLA